MIEHIDYMDEIKLLIELVKKRLKHDVEESNRLTVLLQQSVDCLLTSSNRDNLSSTDQELIHNTIRETENKLNLNIIRLMNQKGRNGEVFRTIFIQDAIGCMKYENLSGIPQFQIRGRTYLNDNEKISSEGKTLFMLRGVQVVSTPQFCYHIATQSFSALPKHYDTNYWIVLNYLVPGTTCVQVIAYYSATPEAHEVISSTPLVAPVPSQSSQHGSTKSTSSTSSSETTHAHGWKNALRTFWKGEEDFCNTRMKLIPNVVESNWMVKMAIGQRPVILGNKLQQSYFRGDRYFEVDIDLSSSPVAAQVLGMVRGYSKEIVIDLGITIEGQIEYELPEEILCQTRFHYVNLEDAVAVTLE